MKKKLLTLLLSIAVILTSTVTVFAEDTFTINNIKYKVLSGNTVEVTGKTMYFLGGDVTIPSTVTYPETDGTTYTVTTIGESAFFDSDIIDSIVIPNTVTSIGDSAFQQCDKLTSVTLPDGLERIGSYAFNLCKKLTEISIPSSVTNIGNFAFYQCISMSSVVCNATTPATLGTDAFSQCTALTSIKVPASFVDTYKSSWSSYSTIIEAIPSQNKTIADILPDDFPNFSGTNKTNGWTNGNCYIHQHNKYLQMYDGNDYIELLSFNTKLTETEGNYVYIDSANGRFYTFYMKDGVLEKINLFGFTSTQNGDYFAQLTVTDLLIDNPDFPITEDANVVPDKAWVNSTNEKATLFFIVRIRVRLCIL